MKPEVPAGRPVLVLLASHWLSLSGTVLVTSAVLSWLFVLSVHARGSADNPYVGILAFLVVPALFFAGLALIPAGVFLARRRLRAGLAVGVDRRSALRRIATFIGVTTLANVVVGTQVTYRAVEHMETVEFCGLSCHAMRPEFSAYQESPHSRVPCVECHVVPGARGWLDSKLAGSRQMIEVLLDSYPRPVPPALQSGRLVPARETCERCHWPEKFDGVRLRVFRRYAEDEGNTESDTVLVMLTGGGRAGGIHGAHVGPGVTIRFAASDGTRGSIPWVERKGATGASRAYAAPGVTDESIRGLPVHTMECVDCHNRPTHAFELPDRAIDRAITMGEIPLLPYIKKKGLAILKTAYASSEEAAARIPAALLEEYRRDDPDLASRQLADIERAGRGLAAIHGRNVFPELNVGWGSYPDHLGHTDSPGCFRCHDGEHASADGAAISQDCTTCHETLAVDETSPEVLKTLGLAERIENLRGPAGADRFPG